MIPLRFYRDKTNVYINNPSGITKKMTIEEFEAMLNGGGGDIPEHSSSNQGEVLSVDANGDLVWKTLPAPSSEILKAVQVYDDLTDTTTLDKTYSEISSALADGKIVALCDVYEEDSVYVYVSSGFIQLAMYIEDREGFGVYATNTNGYGITLSLFMENDGVLTFDSQVYIPEPMYQSFSFVAGTISYSGRTVYNALKSKYCYFISGTAGTNKDYCYLPTEFGKDGTTYYVVLSNGDRYEGGETGSMTKVTVNP